ncbi:MAG: CHAT domain-containing protein [Candidatus Zhuqueibacterota bacterium]
MINTRLLALALAMIFAGNYSLFAQEQLSFHQPLSEPLQATLHDLTWTEQEVSNIDNLLRGDVFLRRQATEANFKKYAPKSRILHLATHTIINELQPMYSYLAFSPKDTLSEDGKLFAYELYNLELNAHLAVLSACNTGSGKLVQGEGIMSLARSFMYAGCPSIAMSLWPVDDKSTSHIMADFYAELIRGSSKDAALRTAKLNYLRHAGEIKSAPYYWAGFVLTGDTSPLELSTARHHWQWIIPAIVLIIISAFLLIKKFRTHTVE